MYKGSGGFRSVCGIFNPLCLPARTLLRGYHDLAADYAVPIAQRGQDRE